MVFSLHLEQMISAGWFSPGARIVKTVSRGASFTRVWLENASGI